MATKSIIQHQEAQNFNAQDFYVLVQGLLETMHSKTKAGNLSIGIVANVYDNTSTYAVDDKVIYDGVLYKCIEDVETAEDFDPTKWQETLAVNEGGGSTDDCLKNTGRQIITGTQEEPSSLEVSGYKSGVPKSISLESALHLSGQEPYLRISNGLFVTQVGYDGITFRNGTSAVTMTYAELYSFIGGYLSGTINVTQDAIQHVAGFQIWGTDNPLILLYTDGSNNAKLAFYNSASYNEIFSLDPTKITISDETNISEIPFSELYNLVNRKGAYPLTTQTSSTANLLCNNPVRITQNISSLTLNFQTPIAGTDNEWKVYFTASSAFTPVENAPSGYTFIGDSFNIQANKVYEVSYAVVATGKIGRCIKEY